MSDHAFHAASLRFVAAKTESAQPDDPRARSLMAVLRQAAAAAEDGRALVVAPDDIDLAARALAGYAAFLHRQILPEAVAHGNAAAEAQLRWSVDAAMAMVNRLLAHAVEGAATAASLELPPPP